MELCLEDMQVIFYFYCHLAGPHDFFIFNKKFSQIRPPQEKNTNFGEFVAHEEYVIHFNNKHSISVETHLISKQYSQSYVAASYKRAQNCISQNSFLVFFLLTFAGGCSQQLTLQRPSRSPSVVSGSGLSHDSNKVRLLSL